MISQGLIDRGLFNGCKFTFYQTELEQKEEFANPDAATTTDIKSASYEKLTNGIIKIGTIVNKGDAIIGKVAKLSKADGDSDYLYSDRSTVYKEIEPAIVHNVIVDRNEDDERFCKVSLRKIRPVVVGDKFSSRSGQLAQVVWQQTASCSTLNLGLRRIAKQLNCGNLAKVMDTAVRKETNEFAHGVTTMV